MLILKIFILAVVFFQSSKPVYAENAQEDNILAVKASRVDYFMSLVDGVVRAVNTEGIHRVSIHGQYTRFYHKDLHPGDVVLFQPLDKHRDIILSADLSLFVTQHQRLVPVPVTQLSKTSPDIVVLHTAMGVFMADIKNRVMLEVNSIGPQAAQGWIAANKGKASLVFSLAAVTLVLLLICLKHYLKRWSFYGFYDGPDSPPQLPVTKDVTLTEPSGFAGTHAAVVMIQGPGIDRAALQDAYPVTVYNKHHLQALATLVTPVAVIGNAEIHKAMQNLLPRIPVLSADSVTSRVVPDTGSNGHPHETGNVLGNIIAQHRLSTASLAVSFRTVFIKDFLNARVTNAEQADFFACFISALQKHYSKECCNVECIAAELATSSRNLSRKIRKTFNISFSELLRQYRLGQSCESLLQGEKITNVAINAGFSTASYYAKCFRERAGATPRKFQMQFMQKQNGIS